MSCTKSSAGAKELRGRGGETDNLGKCWYKVRLTCTSHNPCFHPIDKFYSCQTFSKNSTRKILTVSQFANSILSVRFEKCLEIEV